MTSLERLLLNRISVHFVNKWFTWRKAPIDWNARCRARQVGGYQLISSFFLQHFRFFLWMDSLEFQIFGVQFCLFFVTWKSYANLLVEIAELTEIPLIPSFSNFRLITNQCLKIKKKWIKKIPVFHSAVPSEIDIPSVTSAEVSASSRSDRQINRRLTAARPAHLSTFIVWFSYHLPVQLFSSQTWNVEYILLKTEIMWKLPEQLPFIDYEPHVAHKFHVTSYGYSLDKVNNRPIWPLSLSFTLNSSSCVWITCNVEDQTANTLSFQVHSSGNCVSG